MNFKYAIVLAMLALLSVAGVGKVIDHPTAPATGAMRMPLMQVQSPISPTAGPAATRPGCATLPVEHEDLEDEWRVRQPMITGAVAQQVAEAYVKTGCASQIELEEEDDQFVYTVQIGRTEVELDAMTGVVLDTDYDED